MEIIQVRKMKLLLKLRDDDIGEKTKSGKLATRGAARTIAIKNGKIAFIHVSRHGYHKLPGGGIERGENIKEALQRELLEETGCIIKITGEVGKIIEHRTHIGILQDWMGHAGQGDQSPRKREAERERTGGELHGKIHNQERYCIIKGSEASPR